ncbi:uncharacterized protein B0I36DRAFT_336982 [Microdochium trichocladiopsis]|uniref:Uncharacterized protein n=1 Tax=Microdochium trichocladiopsis TaxID=1682393 RepID=A0A9P9BJN7_9PEZI|nr:uncharacterized protein B0I36DRAFT_336982 [Microdochium trichocladiopsis]KAH7016179.1 hypothetical protein B0I36DRAFT_336982 [Microdochium trichocladiopsis]
MRKAVPCGHGQPRRDARTVRVHAAASRTWWLRNSGDLNCLLLDINFLYVPIMHRVGKMPASPFPWPTSIPPGANLLVDRARVPPRGTPCRSTTRPTPVQPRHRGRSCCGIGLDRAAQTQGSHVQRIPVSGSHTGRHYCYTMDDTNAAREAVPLRRPRYIDTIVSGSRIWSMLQLQLPRPGAQGRQT